MLQVVLTNNFGNFKDGFLILREGVLTDELHDFGKILLLLKDFLYLGLDLHEFGIISIEVVLEHSVVVGVRDVPVH